MKNKTYLVLLVSVVCGLALAGCDKDSSSSSMSTNSMAPSTNNMMPSTNAPMMPSTNK